MQRQVPEGVIIACDFCGTDWDEVIPMIEGHRGSVLCIECLKQSIRAMHDSPDAFTCTLCLRDFPAGKPVWRHPEPCDQANASARICKSCINQAAVAFERDDDVAFTRNEVKAD